MDLEQDRGAVRRRALGGLLRIVRGMRGWSVETAAEKARMGHMTLRRLEDGYAARPKTYATVDELLGLPPGSTHRAIGDDEQMVDLARRVGVDTHDVDEGRRSAHDFVNGLAGAQKGSRAKAAANISVVMHGGATVALDADPPEDFIERLNEAKQKGVLLGLGAFPTTWINPDQVIVVQVNGGDGRDGRRRGSAAGRPRSRRQLGGGERAVASRLWAQDWDSPEDAVYDALDGMDVEAQGEMADELTAAQAEVERLSELVQEHYGVENDQAAELERLRCQLTAAQAAIQRVRQLCAMKPNLIGPDLYAEDVLAALDGDTTEVQPINTSRPNTSGRMTLHESLELIRERYGDAIRQLGEQ